MNKAQLINQDSGQCEWYTPPEIIEAARKVLGRIDLDPFSSEQANKTVKAVEFYSSDAFERQWWGNVWMNHPFSRKMNPLCIKKLCDAFEVGEIEEACCITFAATSEKWFQPLHNYPQCYLVPRTNYYLPDGTKKKGVTKGSVVTYLGSRSRDLVFAKYFQDLGEVKFPFCSTVQTTL